MVLLLCVMLETVVLKKPSTKGTLELHAGKADCCPWQDGKIKTN